MGYTALPQLPNAPESSENKVLFEYLKKLHKTLVQWQTSIGNTNFLGAKGNMTISSLLPASTDGEDDDIWIKK